jgi:hypothetical protein
MTRWRCLQRSFICCSLIIISSSSALTLVLFPAQAIDPAGEADRAKKIIKIQALHRGNASRKRVKQMKARRFSTGEARVEREEKAKVTKPRRFSDAAAPAEEENGSADPPENSENWQARDQGLAPEAVPTHGGPGADDEKLEEVQDGPAKEDEEVGGQQEEDEPEQ